MYDQFTKFVSGVALWLGGLSMAIMGLMTVTDVFMRYVFLSPLRGTSEHTQLLMAVIVFCGLVLVTREGTHIVVSLFEGVLNQLVPKLYDRVYIIANVIGLGFITYAMVIATIDMMEFGSQTMVMRYPLAYLGGFIIVLLGLSVLQLKHLWHHGPSGHDATD